MGLINTMIKLREQNKKGREATIIEMEDSQNKLECAG